MLKPTPTLDYSDSLPSELLCEIFLSVLALNKSSSVANIAELEGFRQVCKKWERTIVSTPELWASIHLDCTIDEGSVATSSKQLLPHHRTSKVKHIKTMARRLKRRYFPADDERVEAELVHKAIMDISHYASLSGSLPLSLSLKLPCRNEEVNLNFLNLERPIIERVRRLELTLSETAAYCFAYWPVERTEAVTPHEPNEGLSGLEGTGWPQLEDLRLVIPYSEDSNWSPPRRSLPIPTGKDGCTPMPRLTSLAIQMYGLDNPFYGDNRRLSRVYPTSHLTHLELDRLSMWDSHQPQFAYGLAVAAERRAHLEDLRLGFSRQLQPAYRESEVLSSALVDGTITFPKLKVLRLRVYHSSSCDSIWPGLDEDLSCALTLPSLEELSIAFCPDMPLSSCSPRNKDPRMKVSTLMSLLSHCGEKLRRLFLANIRFKSTPKPRIDMYSHILSHRVFRNLETLHLADDFLPFYTFMTDGIDDCTFLPCLRHVELRFGSRLPNKMGNLKEQFSRAAMFLESRNKGEMMDWPESLRPPAVVKHGLDCKTGTACGCLEHPRIFVGHSNYTYPIENLADRI
ncbi:hypothetical protein DFP72DRAFT_1044996 [Ephemerocybe angulata]|uniref:F-box domain-containing protein n=1 Tax=Ephemerocybe angulata TaxID=980116 RepID=A0A8H6I0G3_9AGAR|nr:hypothetical protein DFP72DRAFT_1044996 [Tulosesus angulatus]